MKTLYKNSMLVLSLFFLSGHAYSANDEAGGTGTITNTTITDETLWTTLRTVNHTVNGGVGTNDCMVVASADAVNPGPAQEEQYVFTITRNNNGNTTPPLPENTNPAGTNEDYGSNEKVLGFVDNPSVDDIGRASVSTNMLFTGLTSTNGLNGGNTHTFYLLGKKKASTAPALDLTIEDSRIDFVCVDRD